MIPIFPGVARLVNISNFKILMCVGSDPERIKKFLKCVIVRLIDYLYFDGYEVNRSNAKFIILKMDQLADKVPFFLTCINYMDHF